MARKNTHGIQNLFMYPIEGDTYGEAIPNEGARALSREISQEIENLYADNRVHNQIKGTKTTSGEITLYQIEDDVYVNFLGFSKNANGSFSDNNSAGNKSFGLAYAEKITIAGEGDTYRIVSLYDNVATTPNTESTTDEDAITVVEYVIPYEGKDSSFVKDDAGNYVSYMFFDMPIGTTEDEVIALLTAGIPLPTDTFVTTTPSTGTVTLDGTSTADTISFLYSYTANDSDIAESKIFIEEVSNPGVEVDSITPLTEGTDISGSFTGLTANTAYNITMVQGTTSLSSFSESTLA